MSKRETKTNPSELWFFRVKRHLNEIWPTCIVVIGLLSAAWYFRGVYDENANNVDQAKQLSELVRLRNENERLKGNHHAVAKPTISPVRITGVSYYPQDLNEKYVVTYYGLGEEDKSIESLGYNDRACFKFVVTNANDQSRTVEKIGFISDYSLRMPFSGKSSDKLLSADKVPEYLQFDIAPSSENSEVNLEVAIKLDAGETKEIPIQFCSSNDLINTIVKTSGTFVVKTSDGVEACYKDLKLEIHPDGLNVEYGVPPDEVERTYKLDDSEELSVIDVEEHWLSSDKLSKSQNDEDTSKPTNDFDAIVR